MAEADHLLLDSSARDLAKRVFGKLPVVPGGPSVVTGSVSDLRTEFERFERYLEVYFPINLLKEAKDPHASEDRSSEPQSVANAVSANVEFVRLAKVILSRKADLTDFMTCWIEDCPEAFCATKQEANFRSAYPKQWEMFCTHVDSVDGTQVRVPLTENAQVRQWFADYAVNEERDLFKPTLPSRATLLERYDSFALWDEHGMPVSFVAAKLFVKLNESLAEILWAEKHKGPPFDSDAVMTDAPGCVPATDASQGGRPLPEVSFEPMMSKHEPYPFSTHTSRWVGWEQQARCLRNVSDEATDRICQRCDLYQYWGPSAS